MSQSTEIKMVTSDGKEICVLCHQPTDIDAKTHIDLREGYVDGAGQLCKDCRAKI